MDPSLISFDTICSFGTPLKAQHVTAVVSSRFNRIQCPSIDAACIDESWEKLLADRKALGGKLFNGSKFRLHNVALDPTEGLRLELGITDYKHNAGCCRNIEKYRAHHSSGKLSGPDSNSQRLEDYLPQALGVEALVVTSEGCAVLFRRSEEVVDMPGWYCCPGGHPEPQNIFHPPEALSSSYTSLDAVAQWFSCVNSSILVAELFDSAVDEVAAEIGLPRSTLTNDGLMGIVLNSTNRKPDLVFLVRCSLTNKDLLAVYNRREAEEAFESVEGSLKLLPLTIKEVDSAVKRFQVTPPSVACLNLGCCLDQATLL